jgi:hypothetical protein
MCTATLTGAITIAGAITITGPITIANDCWTVTERRRTRAAIGRTAAGSRISRRRRPLEEMASGLPRSAS